MNKMRKAVFACIALFGAQANAAVYVCDGYVQGLTTQRGGVVVLDSFAGSSWIYLCSMTSDANGITASACKNVYATLLTAQASGQRIRLWFDDNLTCATQVPWVYATSWYFGPQMLAQ